VELARSGQVVVVPDGKSILDTLLESGVDVPYSCREGVCGSCELSVLEGEPDHRDLVLTDADEASNKMMLVCCSRSKSERLVLDI
jgi:ferredoxin